MACTRRHPMAALAFAASLAVAVGTSSSGNATVPLEPRVELDRPVVLKVDPRAVYAVVRLEALAEDDAQARARPPLNIDLVLDRSGSMADAGKLDYLKRAAGLLVDQLQPHDVLSLVEYDDQITVMWPAGRVESPHALKRLIEALEPRGNTNLTGGMMAGVEQVKSATARKLARTGHLSRVLLLSDGLANEGVTQPEAIRTLVRQAKAEGAPISTLGLGRDYDEDLMQDIAENAGGRYYYVEHPDQIARIFGQELKALFRTVARDCVVEIDGVPGAEILGFEGRTAAVGDFYAGEKRLVLVRLPGRFDRLGPEGLGTVKVTYTDAATARVHNFAVNLRVEVTDDGAGAARAENREVAVEAVLAETERGQKDAVKLLEAGDLAGADRQMTALAETVKARQAVLADKRLEKKLEALAVERADMAAAALAPEAGSEYLKRTKQRLYQSKQGQRSLSLLAEGDRGYAVERLQEALSAAGYYDGPIDGVYGASLSEAVKAFQQAENLGPDGVAGPATMKELGLY